MTVALAGIAGLGVAGAVLRTVVFVVLAAAAPVVFMLGIMAAAIAGGCGG